jgi:hypothetical protein
MWIGSWGSRGPADSGVGHEGAAKGPPDAAKPLAPEPA